MVFIDGSNFYHGLKTSMGRPALDFEKFALTMCGPSRRLVHTHYYNVPLRQAEDPIKYAGQQKFFSQLRKVPHLTISLGRLADRDRSETCPKCGEVYTINYQTEKGVDVQLAAHLLAHAFDNQYDVAVLVSNDGDFTPVVAEVRRLAKTVENAEFPFRLPSYLSRSCSGVIVLDKKLLKPCMV